MGQFNNGYRRPNFNGNQNFYASNSSLAPVPASQPKSKTKLLIIVAAAGVLLISLFALLGTLRNQHNSKKTSSDIEFLDNLDTLRYDLIHFYQIYDSAIGVVPNISQKGIMPFYGIEDVNTVFNKITEQEEVINRFDEKRSGFEPSMQAKITEFKEKLNKNLENMGYNIEFMLYFEQLFSNEFANIVSASNCRAKINDIIVKKNELEDTTQYELARRYGESLCNIAQYAEKSTNAGTAVLNEDVLDEQANKKIEDLINNSGIKGSLDEINSKLKECDSLTILEDTIDKILEEKEKDDKE